MAPRGGSQQPPPSDAPCGLGRVWRIGPSDADDFRPRARRDEEAGFGPAPEEQRSHRSKSGEQRDGRFARHGLEAHAARAWYGRSSLRRRSRAHRRALPGFRGTATSAGGYSGQTLRPRPVLPLNAGRARPRSSAAWPRHQARGNACPRGPPRCCPIDALAPSSHAPGRTEPKHVIRQSARRALWAPPGQVRIPFGA